MAWVWIKEGEGFHGGLFRVVELKRGSLFSTQGGRYVCDVVPVFQNLLKIWAGTKSYLEVERCFFPPPLLAWVWIQEGADFHDDIFRVVELRMGSLLFFQPRVEGMCVTWGPSSKTC